MGKNVLLTAKRVALDKGLEIGEQAGIQKMCDYAAICLRDPEVMGKDVFGPERIDRFFKKMNELAHYFHLAFTKDPEADVRQEELDKLMREAFGKKAESFYDRYPYYKEFDYTKGEKGWKE